MIPTESCIRFPTVSYTHLSLEFKAEKAFAGCKDEVRLVAAGDGSEATIHQLMEFVKKNRVEQVILPGNHEKVAKELQSAGVKRVVEMKPGSA